MLILDDMIEVATAEAATILSEMQSGSPYVKSTSVGRDIVAGQHRVALIRDTAGVVKMELDGQEATWAANHAQGWLEGIE